MRLFAHVHADGSIADLIAMPDDKPMAMLVPGPGLQVCELHDHGLEGELDPERLHELRENYRVDLTPAHGRLVVQTKGG